MRIRSRRGRSAFVEASAPWVYGAALAAAVDRGTAEAVTCEVLVDAAAGRARGDARSLVALAVLRAVRRAPHPALAPLSGPDREAVALARLAGYSVAEVAEALAIEPREARARMRRGLCRLAAALTGDGGPRTPPPPPGCGTAASRARAGHGS